MLKESAGGTPSVLLVDGMALLFRAYFATAYGGSVKRNRDGVPVNAVHGFLRYLGDAVRKIKPTHLVCCWDLGGGSFRMQHFPQYKGNRPEAPDDLIPQFELIKTVTESFGILNVSCEGFEADDCIGTLARRFAAETDVFVMTGDHDLLQLVDERITVIIMKKGHGNYAVYTPAYLMEERQMKPAQIIDLKGLMGDPSDNYPGVRGIGEKTALKLILEHESIDGILTNLASLPASIRAKIEADVDMLHLSRQLATIHCEAPVSIELSECLWLADRDKITAICEHVEFRDALRWIG
jgi:5'-3' exonuclease